MLFGIVPSNVRTKGFCSGLLRRADMRQNVRARVIRAYLRDKAKQSGTKSLSANIGTIPKNMPTNFELKRLKPKLDIVKKPENRLHKLTLTVTDSNVSRYSRGLKTRALLRAENFSSTDTLKIS